MHIFISAGEPSGDLHAGNLVRALRRIDPDIHCAGFGGDRLLDAGAELLYPLTRLSVMWFPHVLKSYRTFCDIIRQADDYFRDRKPGAVVLIDYPGLHWWLARRAKDLGIPVFYFVPPQLWAWGAWRIEKMRRYVDHVICSLPFEPEWYRQRGVATQYFGHPYFDELDAQQCDESFVETQLSESRPIVAVLPGSRQQEVRLNWPSLHKAINEIHGQRNDVRFLVGAFNREQADSMQSTLGLSQLPVEVHVGRTAEIIRTATACMSVSGSVGLELLRAVVPSVVCYRLRRIDVPFLWLLKKSRYISIVNLLADAEVFPEFVTSRCPGSAMAKQILDWLDCPTSLYERRRRLLELKERAAIGGACSQTAEYIVNAIREKGSSLAINSGSRTIAAS